MSRTICRLTVFFEDPFWVGVYEREDGAGYSACKITFGAEPKDYQVYEFLLDGFHRLHFTPSLASAIEAARHINPKRMQRVITRQLEAHGTGTKAQEAFKLQQEAGKEKRRKASRAQREEEQKRQFQLHRQKQKARHKGH